MRRAIPRKLVFLVLSRGLVLSCAASLLAQHTSSPKPEWKPLDFLLGTWEAHTRAGSAGASGAGTYTFQLELRGSVLARHSSSAECQGPADYNCDHADLLYIYREPSRHPAASTPVYQAIYFDNEGHVIHYEVSVPAPGTAIFLSPPTKEAPQFKLIYERKGATMFGKFQIRMGGQADFKSYLEWDGEKKR